MTRYVLSSSALHLSLLFVLLWSPLFQGRQIPLFITDIDFVAGGGSGGPGGGGIQQEKMGQPVPQPPQIKVPQKAGPVQKAQLGEEIWKVNRKKVAPKKRVKKATLVEPLRRGVRTQEGKSNIIRRGTRKGEKTGPGSFEWGKEGSGRGRGVGIGVGEGIGPGSGFGFGIYLRAMRRRIWSEWARSPIYGNDRACVVSMTVDRRGNVSQIELDQSSGDAFYDNVAMRSIRNASPLPPLPPNFPRTRQRFRINFKLLE